MHRDEHRPAPTQRRIWIVDDSRTEAELTSRALESEFQVEVFLDSSAALEKLTAGAPPDLLVLDWVMPGVSGIEFCQFVRGHTATAELPVLLLTTNQETDQIVEGLEAGANDYLAKPYAAAELRARVAALMRSLELRERAEHAERLLLRVLSQLPDAVLTVDSDGRIVFANPQVEKVFGRPHSQVIGRRLPEFLPQLLADKLKSSPQEARLSDMEIGGRVYSPSVHIPAAENDGNTTITFRDVTDARVREVRRIDFYSMVAHDLRSPLSALQLRATMLMQGMRGELSLEVKKELQKMIDRVRDLVQIVSDFLDISQMESAHFRIERNEVDLGEMCAEVYDEYRPVAASRGLELSVDVAPGAVVIGDARRLSQAVGNLVSNAIKFTGSGGRIAIGLRQEDDSIGIAIEDNGRGIPDDVQGRLFTKYERVGGSAAAKVEGTGLGLVIVKEIIEAHGGTVGVRSRTGEGSTFWFQLPRSPEPA